MATEAINFTRYRQLRENRKLAKQIAALADQRLQWRLEESATRFLKENRLSLADLTHIVRSAYEVVAMGNSTECSISGYTVDEVRAQILLRFCVDGSIPTMVCAGGRLCTDEEDLAG